MAKVVQYKNEDGTTESIDSMIRRWKKKCLAEDVMGEMKKREAYEKPSVKRKKKAEAARKRIMMDKNK